MFKKYNLYISKLIVILHLVIFVNKKSLKKLYSNLLYTKF